MQAQYFAGDSENSSNDDDADEVIFQSNTSSSQATTTAPVDSSSTSKGPKAPDRTSSCRALQKKLEMKVERAKRNYQQLQQNDAGEDWDVCITQPKSTNLIPISRLSYPGRPEQHTLIEYKEVNGTGDDLAGVEDDLGSEEAKFFANKHKRVIKQDLSDTFSIQEMTIESDSEESGSDTLELLAPTDAQYWERLAGMLPCCATKDI